MPIPHLVRCSCGRVTGTLDRSFPVNRCICYCRSCQAFAHFLGKADAVLDRHGGTDIVQIRAQALTFSSGQEELACMRLTATGVLRWYTLCCGTPLGNTPADFRVSLVGVIHSCLHAGERARLDAPFGPVRMHVNTGAARNPPVPRATGTLRLALRLMRMILPARIGGAYWHTPFFRADTGEPVAPPRVLTADEHRSLLAQVDCA